MVGVGAEAAFVREEGFEPVFEHVLGAVGQGFLAHLRPAMALLEGEVEDGDVLERCPLAAGLGGAYWDLEASRWLNHCSRHCLPLRKYRPFESSKKRRATSFHLLKPTSRPSDPTRLITARERALHSAGDQTRGNCLARDPMNLRASNWKREVVLRGKMSATRSQWRCVCVSWKYYKLR